MDTVGLRLQKPFAASVSLASGLFHHVSHRETLVKEPELALGRLGVAGVREDTSVKQSAVHIGNHGANVTKTVRRLLRVAGELDRVEIRRRGVVKVLGVALVDRVDLAALGNLELFAIASSVKIDACY